MKSLSDATVGTLVIVTLIAAGGWYAWDSDVRHEPLTYFSAGASASTALREVSADHLGWSADGQKLLIQFFGGDGAGSRLVIQDVALATPPLPIDAMGDSVRVAALAPDGLHVLIASNEGRLWWIDPESLELTKPLIELHPRQGFSAVAIAGSGRVVAGGTRTGSIYLCDPLRQTIVLLKARSESSVADLHFSDDGKRLVVAQHNGRVSVWDVETDDLLQEFTGHDGPAKAAKLLPDGKRIISAGLDDTVRIWDAASGRELWRGEVGLMGITTLAVSPDGTTAAWAGFNHKIVVCNLERGRKKWDIATIVANIHHLAFSPDGTTLAAAGREELIRLYDVQTGIERDRILLDELQ